MSRNHNAVAQRVMEEQTELRALDKAQRQGVYAFVMDLGHAADEQGGVPSQYERVIGDVGLWLSCAYEKDSDNPGFRELLRSIKADRPSWPIASVPELVRANAESYGLSSSALPPWPLSDDWRAQ
jgi:hypothetical protein